MYMGGCFWNMIRYCDIMELILLYSLRMDFQNHMTKPTHELPSNGTSIVTLSLWHGHIMRENLVFVLILWMTWVFEFLVIEFKVGDGCHNSHFAINPAWFISQLFSQYWPYCNFMDVFCWLLHFNQLFFGWGLVLNAMDRNMHKVFQGNSAFHN